MAGFEGTYLGDDAKLGPDTRLECKICWYVYDPAAGDPVWQIRRARRSTPCRRTGPAPTAPESGGSSWCWTMNDAASPAAVLVDTFAEIHRTRMQGMPFVNEALAVEAVGFAPWGHHWLGVLITPWFMSLMLLPRIREHWQAIPPGDSLSYTFPAGVFDFIAASDARIGEYQACSLFSPVFELADQETARLAAEAARAALFDAANRDVLVPEPIRAPAPMTKRDFLHLPGTDREPGR